MKAWFDFSCTLTYALPVGEVAARLPAGLAPDTYDDRFGFLAVAIVRTRRLRPAAFPAAFGHDFVLAGYRLFVRYTNRDGRTLRGLYILRSETDRQRMVRLGNLFTRYRYVRTGLRVNLSGDRLEAVDTQGGLEIHARCGGDPPLPAGSPFPDWRTARRYCGPMPFTFSADEREHRMHIVEGRRTNWEPEPVEVLRNRVPWLEEAGFGRPVLANAFMVRDVPYQWRRGRSEPLP